MKRTKKVSKKEVITQKNNVKKDIQKPRIVNGKFHINILSVIILTILIGFFAFFHFFSLEYLFFFKDIGSDTINQTYPSFVHKINLISEHFPQWSFYKGMGDYLFTVNTTDPFVLLQRLFFYLGTSVFGVDYLIFGRIFSIFLFRFLPTAIVFYLYLRTIQIKKFSSLIGALLIVFSGYMVVGSSWGFSIYVFKAVFLLFAFEQLFLKRRWYFFPFAVMYLCTDPFILFVYTVFLFIYFIFRTLSEQYSIKIFVRLGVKMLLLAFVGLLMNFVNFFPILEKMLHSPRVAGNASYSNLLSSGKDIVEHGNLSGTTILRFFSSDILGTGSNFHGWFNYFEAPLFYVGLLSLLLFPQVFIFLDKRKKVIFSSFAGFWILTLIFPYLRYAMLAFTGDYFRFGFDFFIPFTLLFFSIYALNKSDETFKINIKLLGITLLLLIIALFFPYASVPTNAVDTNLRLIIVLLLFVYSGLFILMNKSQYKPLSKVALILVLVFELSYFSYKSYAGRVPVTKTEFNKDKAGYADGSIKAVKYIKSIDKIPFYRIEKDYQSGSSIHGSLNDALAQGYYGTTSYSSFNQLNYVRFLEETGLIVKGDETATRWITGFRGYPLLQTFGNVKYHLSKSENPEFLKFGFEKIARKNGITILKNKFYLPFGYTYDKYIDFNDFKKLINYQISVQSLNSVYQELARTVNAQKLNGIIEKLKPLLGKKFSNYQQFTDALKLQLGEDAKKYRMQITKYSTVNFKNQIALLNGFVYEKEFNKNINLSEFKKIISEDTSVILPSEKFNFDTYKHITDSLKQDTLQITSFKQSEISGKINLQKTKMLFFTIPFDKGWHLKVDGKNETLQRINIGFTGIVLPKGNHKIKLYYIPQYDKFTKGVSLFSVLIFWLYLVFYFYKKRKAKTLTGHDKNKLKE